MTRPSSRSEPADTGSDTFERFHYQSSVAVPFCIDVAGGALAALYAEHEEDLAVECLDGSWRFIQIKTRDPHLGPWGLAELMKSKALRSLLRTHRNVGPSTPHTLEVFLEGGLKKNNAIEELGAGETSSPETVSKVAQKLKVETPEAQEFLKHVVVLGSLPSRDTIEARNIDLLGRGSPSTPHSILVEANGKVTSAVLTAMRSPNRGLVYPTSVVNILTADERVRARIDAKRLTREQIQPLLAELRSPRFPHLTSSPGDSPYASKLVLKLRIAGATDAILTSAQELRADATRREVELLTADPDSPNLLDVRRRLRAEAAGVVARHASASRPAVEIWDELLGRLTDRARTCDPHGAFHQDPHLLLGEIAQLTDLCEVEWGDGK